jgi:hypothetical protein
VSALWENDTGKVLDHTRIEGGSMSRGKRVKWNNGAVFAVPLADGSFGVAQAIDHWIPHAVYVALTNLRVKSTADPIPSLHRSKVISLLAVNDRALDFGEWKLLCEMPLLAARLDFPNERFRANGYVGGKSYDGGIAAAFLSAYHALVPWDCYYRPDYLDEMLLSPDLKPPTVVFKSGKSK